MQRKYFNKMYIRGENGRGFPRQYPQRFSRRDVYQSDCEDGQNTNFGMNRSRSISRCRDPQQGGNNNFMRHNRSSSLNRFQNQQLQSTMYIRRGTRKGYPRQNSNRFSRRDSYNSDCEDILNNNFGMHKSRNVSRFPNSQNVEKQWSNVRENFNQSACYNGRTNKFHNHEQSPYQDYHGHQEPAMDGQDNQNSESSFHNGPSCSSQRYNHNQGYSEKFDHNPNNTDTLQLQNFKFTRQNEYYANEHDDSQMDQNESPPQMDKDHSPLQMEPFDHSSLQPGRFDHPPPQTGRFDHKPPQLGPFDRPPPKIIRMHHSDEFSTSSNNRPQCSSQHDRPLKQEENRMSSGDDKKPPQQETNGALWVVNEPVLAAIRGNYPEDQWETARLAFEQINDMAFKKISTYHCEYCSIRSRTEQDIVNHKKTKHHISKREVFFKEWVKTLSQ